MPRPQKQVHPGGGHRCQGNAPGVEKRLVGHPVALLQKQNAQIGLAGVHLLHHLHGGLFLIAQPQRPVRIFRQQLQKGVHPIGGGEGCDAQAGRAARGLKGAAELLGLSGQVPGHLQKQAALLGGAQPLPPAGKNGQSILLLGLAHQTAQVGLGDVQVPGRLRQAAVLFNGGQILQHVDVHGGSSPWAHSRAVYNTLVMLPGRKKHWPNPPGVV